jgi:hypothetical protein
MRLAEQWDWKGLIKYKVVSDCIIYIKHILADRICLEESVGKDV